jgi:hypothetical protein
MSANSIEESFTKFGQDIHSGSSGKLVQNG